MKVRAIISPEGVIRIYVLSPDLMFQRYVGILGGRLREIKILPPYLYVETDDGACLWADDIRQGQRVTHANDELTRELKKYGRQFDIFWKEQEKCKQ